MDLDTDRCVKRGFFPRTILFADIALLKRFNSKTKRHADFQTSLLLSWSEFLLQKKPCEPGKRPIRPNMDDKKGGSG